MNGSYYGHSLPDGSLFKEEIVQVLEALDVAAPKMDGMQEIAHVDVIRLFTKTKEHRLAEIPGIRERLPVDGDTVDECLLALLKVIEIRAREGL